MSRQSSNQNHSDNRRDNTSHNSQSKQNRGEKPKTLQEWQQIVKAEYFQKHYAEILKFKQTDYLDKLVEETETFVNKLGGHIKTHQLRQVFKQVKAADNINALKLLRPKLAYVAARVEKKEAKKIVALLEGLIREVNSDTQLDNFKLFFEALVAYHKFYHGSKNEDHETSY